MFCIVWPSWILTITQKGLTMKKVLAILIVTTAFLASFGYHLAKGQSGYACYEEYRQCLATCYGKPCSDRCTAAYHRCLGE